MENNVGASASGATSPNGLGLGLGQQMPQQLRRITIQEADNGFLFTEQNFQRMSPVTLVAKSLDELKTLIGDYFTNKENK